MNSEELELSLRTEFESYLNNVLAETRQEISDFQGKLQSEFEKHRSQLDSVFQEFSTRVESDKKMDDVFKEAVVEHLRLARDEGARITASAIAEAEEMQEKSSVALVAPVAKYTEIRDAIDEISRQDSQSAILKSLVNHAANFTPRGAFFIIKNEHFVGWRVFGKEGDSDEQAVREVFFPMSSETVLSQSVRSLSAVESSYGAYSDDSIYLNKLEFGQPDRMYAIPLVARGRGVAVLYADYGNNGDDVNVEALETLVRVAGLTVELLAASQNVKPAKEETSAYYTQESSESADVNETASNDYSYSGENKNFADVQEVSDNSYSNNSYNIEEPAKAEEYEAETFNYQTVPEYSSEKEENVSSISDNDTAEFEYTSSTESEVEPVEEVNSVGFEQPSYEIDNEEDGEDKIAETEAVEENAPTYSWMQPVDSSEKFEENHQVEEEVTQAEETPVSNTDFAFNSNPFSVPAENNFDEAATTTDYSSTETNQFEVPNYETPQFEAPAFEQPVEEAKSFDSSQFETPQYNQWENNSYEEPKAEEPKFEEPKFETPQYNGFETPTNPTESFTPAPVEPVIEAVAPATTKSRFSERNVDLPIDVADDERRLHNDARRFARLLVSEIKLYNEQKVKEGRESSDLYERLREAIDRSREMYDKRVQPPVASKFDYFHYELVSNLAEGDEQRLGASYPGANV